MTMSETPSRPRPRRPQLTREAVIEAAARVMAREGYDGLTMRAIADELGVQAPALYWHVGAKEELEALLYDHLMSGFTVTLAGADWRESIRNAAQQLRRYLRSKRDISRIIPVQMSLGPNSSAQLDGSLALLRGAGLSVRDAADAFNMLFGYVVDWASAEADLIERLKAGVETPPRAAPAADPNLYPFLAEAGEDLVRDDIDGRFAFGLECLIGGLEKIIAATTAG